MVIRALSLLPEACLGVAGSIVFAALVAAGSRAGRVAHRAALTGAALAVVSAILTLRADDQWLFAAYRVDLVSQIAKAAIGGGILMTALLGRRAGDPFSGARAVGPFFRLVAALALCVAASAADLLALWLAVETATAALLVVLAAEGRWSSVEKLVRRLVAGVLPSALLIGLGVVVMAGVAGSTRYEDLLGSLAIQYARPTFLVAATLAVWSLVARLVFVTVQLRAGQAAGQAVHGVPEISLVAGVMAAVLRLMALVGGIPLPHG